jgi:hypothetical protein
MRNLVPLLLLLMMVTTSGLAQQPQLSAAGASRAAVPSLTTEDVRRRNPAAVANAGSAAQENQQSRFAAAEIEWNERYARTRARVRELLRRADQAELDSVRARNEIFAAPHQPEEINALNERFSRQLDLSRNLRAEAEEARLQLDALLEEARVNGYLIRSFSLFKRNGEPDPDSFRERFLELQQDLREAEARVAVYQLRVNRAFTKYRSIGCVQFDGTGRCVSGNDIFYQNRVRAELNEAKADLEAARARVAALTAQLEELKQRGLQAGLPPGLFR